MRKIIYILLFFSFGFLAFNFFLVEKNKIKEITEGSEDAKIKFEGRKLILTGPKGSKELSINDKIFTTSISKLFSLSALPIPEISSSWGVSIAPAHRITSLLAFIVNSLPSDLIFTPIALLFSNKIFNTLVFFRSLKFE